uniref:Uncharacterized protein n=1 Tax=viral metagenome TaxID=1070528 RepID=A0A6C0L7Q3_9ZZZZ
MIDSLKTIVAVSLIISSGCSIAAVKNAMSGQTAIWKDIYGYLIAYCLYALLFSIFFIQGFSSLPVGTRKQCIFIFICVAYIMAAFALHLSTVRIKTSYA